MKIKNVTFLLLMLLILSGCNIFYTGNDVPEGFSDKYYKMFIKNYEVYEEWVKEQNGGQFINENGEMIYEGVSDPLSNSDIAEVYYNDVKNIESGMEGKVVLTEKEDQLFGDFLVLNIIKSLDFNSEHEVEFMNQFENIDHTKDPVQSIIELEKSIIDTLELDKKSITESLHKKDEENKIAENNELDENKSVNETVEDDQEIDISDDTDWDKLEYLGGALEGIEEYLEELEYMNDDLMSLAIDIDETYETLENLKLMMGDMELIIKDPETNKHLSDDEIKIIKQLLKNINGIIYTEEQLVEQAYYSDNIVSTEDIRKAQADISEIITDIEILQSK